MTPHINRIKKINEHVYTYRNDVSQNLVFFSGLKSHNLDISVLKHKNHVNRPTADIKLQ